MQKPSASFLSSPDPLMFLKDSGTYTNLGDSLNLFSSTGYNKCIEHLLCCLHWLAVNLKTNPRLSPLSWSHLVSWFQCRGCPRLAVDPWLCLSARLGCAGSTALCGQEGTEGQPSHPNPGSQLCSAACWAALCCWHLILFPPVFPPCWHHLQWHSELGITALWLMARTFPLIGEVLLLSLYNFMEISSWKLSSVLSDLSMVKETLRSVAPTRAVFPNDLQKTSDLFWMECYFLSLFMQFLFWKCIGGKDNCLILSFAPFKTCMDINTLPLTKTMSPGKWSRLTIASGPLTFVLSVAKSENTEQTFCNP